MTIGGGISVHNHSGASQGGATLAAHCPAGTIQWFGHANQPATAADWLECNGQNVSRTTFAVLFAAVGVTWGVGDGSTTFTLPDMRRRVPVGKGGVGTGTLGNAAGNTGGSETAVAEIQPHSHGQTTTNLDALGPTAYKTAASAADSGSMADSLSTASAGAGGNHNNIAPSAVGGFWIKT